ncbi:MAG TPA: lytic transglycosylase domain-containing protein [Longimicrobiales bacterium]|nr:lytic transglycosylase domain-containing protein [Longimicrobiales bacterium]
MTERRPAMTDRRAAATDGRPAETDRTAARTDRKFAGFAGFAREVGARWAGARERSPRLVQLLVGTGVALPALLFTWVTGAKPVAPLAAAPAPAVAPAVAAPKPPTPPAPEPPSPEKEAAELASHFERKGFRVSDGLAKQIARAAAANGIDTDVAFGLVATESGFRNSATSSVGAVGLSQLMPRTAAWLEPGTTRGDLRRPSTNLQLGFRYLRHLIDRYDGDVELGLTAYNRGPGTVDRILKRGGDPDNGYAGKVLGGAR